MASKSLIVLCFLFGIALSVRPSKISVIDFDAESNKPAITKEMVDYINQANTTWVASMDQGAISGITLGEARSLCGTIITDEFTLPVISHEDKDVQLPDNFDARQYWV